MDETQDNARIQAILASGIKIPPLPDVLIQLQNLLRDPDASAADVAKVIQQDGALSGAVFRVVGSPVFGLRAKVTTLDHAIALLGIPPTLGILRGLALRHAFSDPASQAALESLWHRSSQIAHIATVLCKQLRKSGVASDQAYTLGMFHDCGLALLVKRYPAYAAALSAPEWPDVFALDEANNTDHALMGQQVAKNWQLPEIMANAIRQHHNPNARLDEPTMRLIAMLNFACHLHAKMAGSDTPAWETDWKAVVMSYLKLDESDIEDVETETRLQLEGV